MALLISCRPELISSNIAVDMMDNAKGVAPHAHPTATTTKEDSDSKSGQNHPHDFTKRQQKKTAIQNQAKITHTTSRRGTKYCGSACKRVATAA
jgi:hypothetical protein